MKNIIFFLAAMHLLWCGILQAQHCSGTTAAPYPVMYHQPDGSTLMVQGRGNRYLHYMQTLDAYTLKVNENGVLEYAILGADGHLYPSGIQAHDPIHRTTEELELLRHIAPNTFDTKAVRQEKRLQAMEENYRRSMAAAFPTIGTHRVLLLLIQYPDLAATHTVDEFDDLMNEPNFNGTGSFRDFFRTSSFNQLTLNTDVFGWYTAANNSTYYADDNGLGRARELGREAIDAAEAAGVDFSVYDNDMDGAVDGIIFVHAGPGAEEGAITDLYIWSHRSRLSNSGMERTYDGVLIDDYMMNPERRGNNSRMVGVGIFCHEFGHGLGLPDLYDIDDSDGDSEGIGWWGLMGSGNWAGGEDSPTNFSAWSKIKLGWQTATDITGQVNGFQLRPASLFNNEVYRISTPDPNEYFLLENRQNVGIDIAVPGHGMIIWHIDDNLTTNADENHKWVDVEEADGLNQLDHNINRGNGGDPFPGTTNNKVFNDTSNPNSKRYNGDNTNTDINNIREEGTLIRFNMGCDPADAVCRAFVNLYLDLAGTASLAIADVDNGSTFDCGFNQWSLSQTNFNCSHIGYNLISLAVEDDNGNTDECTTNVYVHDELPPTLNTPADVLVDCWYSPTTPDATGEATATDNCDPSPEITYTDSEIVFENGARQITRTWKAEDNHNNISMGQQVISIPPPIEMDAGDDQTVYVNFVGIPGYPYSACANLSANVIGGTPPYTFLWSDGQSGEDVEVCPDMCTQYTVTVTDSKGCIQVDSLIVYAIIVECMSGQNPNLMYLLCHNNKTICTSFSSTEVHLSHGDGLGACGDIGDQGCEDLLPYHRPWLGDPIAAHPDDTPGLQLTPNPAAQFVDVRLRLDHPSLVDLQLYDLYGRIISSFGQYDLGAGHQHLRFPISSVPPGSYILHVTGTGQVIYAEKLLVQY